MHQRGEAENMWGSSPFIWYLLFWLQRRLGLCPLFSHYQVLFFFFFSCETRRGLLQELLSFHIHWFKLCDISGECGLFSCMLTLYTFHVEYHSVLEYTENMFWVPMQVYKHELWIYIWIYVWMCVVFWIKCTTEIFWLSQSHCWECGEVDKRTKCNFSESCKGWRICNFFSFLVSFLC